MPSKNLKIKILPDQYYHIYNRGNNRERIFFHHNDYEFFMDKYLKYLDPYVHTFAFCLLPNHFHFLIRTRIEPNGMCSPVPNQLRKLFISYAIHINKGKRRSGSLFTKNYRRIPIMEEEYLKTLVHYIHLNPFKHGYSDDFKEYRHSSYPMLLNGIKSFLAAEETISWFGNMNEFIKSHLVAEYDNVTNLILEQTIQ